MRDLHALWETRPGSASTVLDWARATPRPRLEALRARWNRGERDLSADVTAGLRDGDLMRAADCDGRSRVTR
jgi:hypothetical protein